MELQSRDTQNTSGQDTMETNCLALWTLSIEFPVPTAECHNDSLQAPRLWRPEALSNLEGIKEGSLHPAGKR